MPRVVSRRQVWQQGALGVPAEDVRILSLVKSSTLAGKRVAEFTLPGGAGRPAWTQAADTLIISKPAQATNSAALVYEISFAD